MSSLNVFKNRHTSLFSKTNKGAFYERDLSDQRHVLPHPPTCKIMLRFRWLNKRINRPKKNSSVWKNDHRGGEGIISLASIYTNFLQMDYLIGKYQLASLSHDRFDCHLGILKKITSLLDCDLKTTLKCRENTRNKELYFLSALCFLVPKVQCYDMSPTW